MPNKLVVIGLDCLTPQFLYGGWLADMPNFGRLLSPGVNLPEPSGNANPQEP